MMPKAVLFDLDDTLVDHRGAARLALEALRKANEELGKQEMHWLEEMWVHDFQKYWKMVLLRSTTLKENRILRLKKIFKLLGSNVVDRDLENLAEIYGDVYMSGCSLIPGSVEFMKMLKEEGLKIGIVTNNLGEIQEKKMDQCGMADYVDSLTGAEYGLVKPGPEIFEKALGRIGCSNSEAVMIGDSFEYDVQGALGAGIRAVWFNTRDLSPPPGNGEIPVLRSYRPAENAWKSIVSLF